MTTAAPSRAAKAVRAGKPDEVLLAAVDLARAAAVAEAGEPGRSGAARVGAHLGGVLESERVMVHRFAAVDPAYVGWVWAVEVTRASRAKNATVTDAVLLPDAGALLAPAWVPYEERLRPGDLRVGDVLATAPDDARLCLTRDDALEWSDDALWLELGLGRPRVLSAEGRDDAAGRWWDGEPGPEAAIARAAPATCASCGFWVRLVGSLGQVFGVCANELAPDDGSVVATAHGCGAHSEAVVPTVSRWADLPTDDGFEVVDLAPAAGETVEGDVPAGDVAADDAVAEEIPAAVEDAVTSVEDTDDTGDTGDTGPAAESDDQS